MAEILERQVVHDFIIKAYGYKKGSRSIKMTLEHDFGIVTNRKKIQHIIQNYGIVCPHRKANPYIQMAKATKEHCIVPNKLERQFKQGVPSKVLLTDISYLPYNGPRLICRLSKTALPMTALPMTF